MENNQVYKQVKHLRQAGGYAVLPELGLIEVKGKDAGKFLQFRTTSDVLCLASGCGQASSILSRTAHILGYFSIHRLDSAYWIVLERTLIEPMIEQMEQYHFKEEVEFIDRSGSGVFLSVQGPLSPLLLLKLSGEPVVKPQAENGIAQLAYNNRSILCMRKNMTGDDGFLFFVSHGDRDLIANLTGAAGELGFCELYPAALNIARVEAGIPEWGIDMDAGDLLPDTGLEQEVVSFTKGCYLGQEVIARIKTYSAPRKGLMGIVFAPGQGSSFALDQKLKLDDKDIGVLKSSVHSPTLKCTIGMASLLRDYRVPDQKLSLTISGAEFPVTTQLLPFYHRQDRRIRAKQFLDQGLTDFAKGDEQEAIQAVRKSLALAPELADAYEVLGVILSRQGNLEQAIQVMKELVRIDSESIMAHANLSVFYMQQGNKETAEEEKALAMSIRMQMLARQMHEEADIEAQKAEAAKRMEMFNQVLEIDSEDFLANQGLGSIHVELGDFEKALPYLQKVIDLKPGHTVAYLCLGQAFAGLKRNQQAAETYRKGIEVASKRGDMTPLKDMQARLLELEKQLQEK